MKDLRSAELSNSLLDILAKLRTALGENALCDGRQKEIKVRPPALLRKEVKWGRDEWRVAHLDGSMPQGGKPKDFKVAVDVPSSKRILAAMGGKGSPRKRDMEIEN